MFRPTFAIAADAPALRAAAWALVAMARDDLRRNAVPPLYASRVRYVREGPNRDHWQLPSQTLASGTGDCEDLAGWRAAELREKGIRANVLFLPMGAPRNWHAVVQWPDGAIEDPAAALGMAHRVTSRIRGGYG